MSSSSARALAGLSSLERLAGAPVRITMIDRRNHHLFQPLLYQVATTSLATSEIAWPIRHLLRRRKDVTTLLGRVTGVDAVGKRVLLEDGSESPTTRCVLATGARHAYFGHDEWEPFAPGLKTLEDATTIRRRILLAFEHAERETDPEKRRALMTLVIIGGGPTGVELAGTIAELARDTLAGEFRNIDTDDGAGRAGRGGRPRVLPNFRAEAVGLCRRRALERLGVDRRTRPRRCPPATPTASSSAARRLPARTIIWAAGVAASPAARMAGRAGRPGRADDRRARPDGARPSPRSSSIGDTAHVAAAGRQAGAGRGAGRQAAGQTCRGNVSARGWPATAGRRRPFGYRPRRRPRDDRQARRGDRLRLDRS